MCLSLAAHSWQRVLRGAAGLEVGIWGWRRYDSRGEEGADKCSWKYGETWQADNGALANMKLNGRSYMIQMNWAVGQGCSMGW